MAGLFLDNGKNNAVTLIVAQTLYLALITNEEIGSDWASDGTNKQIGGDLTEVTGTGYARITLTPASWSIDGDNVATYPKQTFTVGSGGWNNVKGYAICTGSSGNNAIWAESFPSADQGNKNESATIKVTPSFQTRTLGE